MSNYQELFEQLKLNYIKNYVELDKQSTLFITRCCAVKSSLLCGTMESIYISSINQNFYKMCKYKGLKYATLSDKYGIVYPQDLIDNYDLHPSKLTDLDKENLVRKIKQQLGQEIKNIVFYNTSPLMSLFYLKIITSLGENYNYYYVSDLSKLEKDRRKKLL